MSRPNKIDQLALRVAALEKQYDGDVWLDSADLYEMLHISKRTLAYWRDNGMIPFYRYGRLCWYKKSEVNALIESLKHINSDKTLSKHWRPVEYKTKRVIDKLNN